MESLNYNGNTHSLLIAILLFCIMQTSSFKAHAQASLTGKWKNSYGSILSITQQNPDGSLAGTYSSSTGSTGIYQVSGHYFTNPENGNTALILLISWNSLDGSTQDPSRFWTSSMSGVFYPEANSIELINCISAPAPFSAVQIDEPGVYPETLVFRKDASSLTAQPIDEGDTGPHQYGMSSSEKGRFISTSPLEGTWKLNDGSQIPYTDLVISKVRAGKYSDVFSGQVTIKGVSQPIGITGLLAHEAPDYEQSLSLSLTNPAVISGSKQGPFITGFSGLLNRSEKTLQLVTTASRPVDHKNKYAATSIAGTSYKKA